MVTLNGFKPKRNDYYVALVSLRESNPKHKVIIKVTSVDKDIIYYIPLTYEEQTTYVSTNLPHFELIAKIDMN